MFKNLSQAIAVTLITIGTLGSLQIGWQMYEAHLFPWQWPRPCNNCPEAEFSNSP